MKVIGNTAFSMNNGPGCIVDEGRIILKNLVNMIRFWLYFKYLSRSQVASLSFSWEYLELWRSRKREKPGHIDRVMVKCVETNLPPSKIYPAPCNFVLSTQLFLPKYILVIGYRLAICSSVWLKILFIEVFLIL